MKFGKLIHILAVNVMAYVMFEIWTKIDYTLYGVAPDNLSKVCFLLLPSVIALTGCLLYNMLKKKKLSSRQITEVGQASFTVNILMLLVVTCATMVDVVQAFMYGVLMLAIYITVQYAVTYIRMNVIKK